MTDLIQKLRDAASGSRELDAEIALALGWRPHMPRRHQGNPRARYEQCSRHPGTFELYIGSQPCGKEKHVPKLTTSLDAIIGLIEEKLPGSSVLTAMSPEKTVCDIHEKPLGQVGKWHGHADHADKVLALCLALLSALEGESDGRQ